MKTYILCCLIAIGVSTPALSQSSEEEYEKRLRSIAEEHQRLLDQGRYDEDSSGGPNDCETKMRNRKPGDDAIC